jgi:hypothetical protein
MAKSVKGMPGGAQKAGVTTSPVSLDLAALSRQVVDIWSDDQDLWFCLAEAGTSPALTIAGDLAASDTALKADRIGRGYRARRVISARYPLLCVATVTGTGTVHVKSVSDEDGSE